MDNFSELAEIEQLILKMNQKTNSENQINSASPSHLPTNRNHLG